MKPTPTPDRAWSVKLDKDLEPIVKIAAAKSGQKIGEWIEAAIRAAARKGRAK